MRTADFVVFEREDQPVGILKAEVDAIGIGELVPGDTLPVDEDSVTAVQILDEVVAILGARCARGTGSAIIAQNQVVVALPADGERQRIEQYAAAISGRIDHRQAAPAGVRMARS